MFADKNPVSAQDENFWNLSLPSRKQLADLQALPALPAVNITRRAGPEEQPWGWGTADTPSSPAWSPLPSEGSSDLCLLSWPFSLVPSRNLHLQPQPGVWGLSGKNVCPLSWPLRGGARHPAQALDGLMPAASSNLQRHSGTR